MNLAEIRALEKLAEIARAFVAKQASFSELRKAVNLYEKIREEATRKD